MHKSATLLFNVLIMTKIGCYTFLEITIVEMLVFLKFKKKILLQTTMPTNNIFDSWCDLTEVAGEVGSDLTPQKWNSHQS